jgi:hypothetical protein
MKRNLIIGTRYWLGELEVVSGVFYGIEANCFKFKDIEGINCYIMSDDGFVRFGVETTTEFPPVDQEENSKSIFDLRDQASTDLDRLEMGINSGIVDAHKTGLIEVEETLIAFRLIVKLARQHASERESKEWVEREVKDILNTVK